MDRAVAARLDSIRSHLQQSAKIQHEDEEQAAKATTTSIGVLGVSGSCGGGGSGSGDCVPQRFAGKYALITGASKGIGAAIAIRLAREGAHVGIVYGRDRAGAERTRDQIVSFGIPASRTFIAGADMGDPTGIEGLFDAYFAHWPRLDVCIPNAGSSFAFDGLAACRSAVVLRHTMMMRREYNQSTEVIWLASGDVAGV